MTPHRWCFGDYAKIAVVEANEGKLRRRKTPWVVGTLMLASLVLLVLLQSTNLWKTFTIESSSDLILLYALSSLNFIAFIVFAFIFLRSIVKLVRERRTFQMGAQIKTRLLIYFFAVSLLPIIAMAAFSYLFMNRALDRWFSQIPQSVIQQAREFEKPAITDSLKELDRLGQEKNNIRRVALLTLGVLTFLLIFASTWIAFYVARGLTTPIKALAEGAGEIAAGNLGHRVDVLAEDELAILVNAFNDMSARLEANSKELAERRRYIETVFESLPTGVISFDSKWCVTTINGTAATLLSKEKDACVGGTLNELVSGDNRSNIERLLTRAARVGQAAEQILFHNDGQGDELTVALTATKLPADGGVVLVIEDLSELITAQRASAWQEVARRMAHEIKNPLTPIQLSAERIAKRFDRSGHRENGVGQRLDDKGPMSVVIQESTDTILREVTSLKSMVDEFSRFARLPEAVLEMGDLNEVVSQAVASVDGRSGELKFEFELATDLPAILIDAEQMKRVFINLVDNSIEAFDEGPGQISITTRHDTARDLVVAEVADNGKGISPSNLQKLFQPYFSTKGRGTGLGLAIVQRIIAEHHGRIHAVKNQPRGARFIVEIPVSF